MNKTLKTKDLIPLFKQTHGNKYDYSLTEYKKWNIKIKIICTEHGIFEQLAYQHKKGQGCKKCANEKLKNDRLFNNKIFIKKAKKIHSNKYDYSLVEYKGMLEKVKIICTEHGIFEVVPNNHLNGNNCTKCNKAYKLTKEIFIEKAKKLHGDKYDYSLVDYKNSRTKVKIICSEHGVFEQLANNHLRNMGCPICNESKGERKVSLILKNKNILYIREMKFDDCKDKQHLPFDFYLPNLNMCLEFDGRQHYKEIFGKSKLTYTQKHDKIKDEYCKNNNIRLLRIKYDENVEEKLNTFLAN